MAQGLVPEDLYRMVFLEEPVLDPAGGRVFYVERRVNEDRKGYHTRIMEWSADGQHRPLTAPVGNNWAPLLSPDGQQLAFMSNRTGRPQLWVLPLTGGEARPLTELPFAAAAAAWAPDSRRIAFAAAESLAEPLQAGYAEDVVVVRRRHYRTNGERMHEERHRALYVSDLAGGVEKVSGDSYDYAAPAWSPDGRSLAVISRRGADADGALFRDVWRLDLETRTWTRLTETLAASAPAWSPDGGTIAFYGHDGRFGRATCSRLWAVPAGGGEPSLVRPEWDVEPGSHVLTDARGTASVPGPLWAAGGREIWVVADEGGASRLYAVPRDGGPVRTLLSGDRAIYGLSVDAATGEFALAAQTARSPGEISVGTVGGGGGDERAITDANPWLKDVWLGDPASFMTESPDGLTVEAWALKPQGGGEAGPAVLEIHGGPHGAYGHSFFFEFQMLAGRGIGVVYSNPRGSTGYGQDHCTPVQDHWGVDTSHDVLAVMDNAVARYPWIDPSRLGITGGSFGGYLTNWILTQTARFKAALAQRSVSNRYSFVGTSDMGFRGMEEYGGPWAEPEHYRDSSPLAFADRITTPLLLLHSEEDWRCPIEQAEQLFAALKMLGREVEMVRYPGESHELSRNGRPYHRVDRLWRIARWFGERL